MQHLFRNETRIRAGWRLLLQALLLLVLLFLILGITQQLPWPIFASGNVAITVAVLGSVYLAGRFLDKRPFSHFGFHFNRRWWLDFGFGFVVGTAVLVTIFGILWAAGWIRIVRFSMISPSFAPLIIWSLVNYVLVGINEELFSRGYQLKNLCEGFAWLPPQIGISLSVLLSSSVFALLHALNENGTLLNTLPIIAAGVLLAVGPIMTGELAIPIGIHIAWNFVQGNMLGFPVSGSAVAVSFLEIDVNGPAVWTGGNFGPEAGLVCLVVCILFSAMVVAWIRRRSHETIMSFRTESSK